jgi:hypothetical protein
VSGPAMIPLTTDQKGEIAVAKVQMEAAKKGALVFLPTRPARYDLLLDWQGKFYRAQVKYADGKAQHSVGAVCLNLRRRKKICYTTDEIDVLLVYLPRLDRVAWLGPEVFNGKAALYLRLQPAKNGQKCRCRMIEEFLW